MGRGHKKCPSCSTILGCRQKKCPCGHNFKIMSTHRYVAPKKSKPLPPLTEILAKENPKKVRRRRVKKIELIPVMTDWHTILHQNDVIRVVGGSGPYKIIDEVKHYMGYVGRFKVKSTDHQGILAYPIKARESGLCYIYMGEEFVCKKSGLVKCPHKIVKIIKKE